MLSPPLGFSSSLPPPTTPDTWRLLLDRLRDRRSISADGCRVEGLLLHRGSDRQGHVDRPKHRVNGRLPQRRQSNQAIHHGFHPVFHFPSLHHPSYLSRSGFTHHGEVVPRITPSLHNNSLTQDKGGADQVILVIV
jgi:hypothetical protein